MTQHLVLLGGGHAHLMALARLERFVSRGHRVTVVQPSAHHYYSGMGPGMLGGAYRPEQIRFDTRRRVEAAGGTFVLDRAVLIDPQRRRVYLEAGPPLDYDVLSCNTGSAVPWEILEAMGPDIFFVKPIESLILARQRLQTLAAAGPVRVAVAGGGAAAVEIAGNAWRVLGAAAARHRVRLYAGRLLLSRFPDRVRRSVLRSLRGRRIEVIEGPRIQALSPRQVVLDDGRRDGADFTFVAVGVRPADLFERSRLPVGPDGGLRVNACLQSPVHPEIFGGGDCIHFAPRPLDKAGVYAVRQNPVLCHNLLAALEGRPLKRFDPGGDYLVILNLGDGTGLLYRSGRVLGGRLAFGIKDWIDRRFMRRFRDG
jgi:NADH dehydrogenase FAD-containing subunit